MSKTKNKIVDLVMDSDGAYSPKRVKKNMPAKHKKFIDHNKTMIEGKSKYLLRNEADDFLNGIDAGLDFLDEIVPRIDRFLGLRG